MGVYAQSLTRRNEGNTSDARHEGRCARESYGGKRHVIMTEKMALYDTREKIFSHFHFSGTGPTHAKIIVAIELYLLL